MGLLLTLDRFFLLFRRRFLVPLGDFGGGDGGLTIKLGGGAGGAGGAGGLGGRGRDVVGFSVGFVISEPPGGGAGGPGGRVGFGFLMVWAWVEELVW